MIRTHILAIAFATVVGAGLVGHVQAQFEVDLDLATGRVTATATTDTSLSEYTMLANFKPQNPADGMWWNAPFEWDPTGGLGFGTVGSVEDVSFMLGNPTSDYGKLMRFGGRFNGVPVDIAAGTVLDFGNAYSGPTWVYDSSVSGPQNWKFQWVDRDGNFLETDINLMGQTDAPFGELNVVTGDFIYHLGDGQTIESFNIGVGVGNNVFTDAFTAEPGVNVTFTSFDPTRANEIRVFFEETGATDGTLVFENIWSGPNDVQAVMDLGLNFSFGWRSNFWGSETQDTPLIITPEPSSLSLLSLLAITLLRRRMA